MYATKTYPGIQPIYSQNFLCRAALSACAGIALGITISLIVNCTLLEISLNAFFATYFGILFCCVGCIILWRLKQQEVNTTHPSASDEADARRKFHLQVFSYLIILSGVLCFMLEKDWYFKLSPLTKVPLYSILGISVSFALTFSVIDLVNYTVGFVQGNTIARPIVESPNQVHVVLILAFFMGAIFGCIFGLMQVADESAYKIRLSLLRVEHYCYQIGGLLGAIGGVANEYLRHIEVVYSPVSLEFDDDI
mmetsp:Transcript_18063/g.45237  ORF Transcript_18063/g.45237 Transcript_18063/m.45237 type:complete len:251 (+) Transcript_18063:402-1154(+)